MTELPTDAIQACIETVDSLKYMDGYDADTDTLTKPAVAQLDALKAKIVAQAEHIDVLVTTCEAFRNEIVPELKADNELAWDLVQDARDSLDEWGAYTSDYFKAKWDFAADLKMLDDALAEHNGDTQ